MKLIQSAVLLATLVLSASANDISGTWKAWFVGPIGDRPKMVSEMIFDLTVDGDKVTGMAHMANWPGDAPISEGKINGDRVSFTVVGKQPWRSSGPTGESSGYPKLDFVVKLNVKEAELTVTWGNVMIYGNSPGERTLEMSGKKVN
jgi:hypothetical protein